MPPLRPLTRTFPVAFTPARKPVIASITAQARPAIASQTQNFSSSGVARSGDSHYDPPSGWLFGIPPGEKREPEGWEKIWVWGFYGSMGLAVIAYAYKPDTSIQTWALEEARRRLEAEGILPDPESAGDPSESN